MNELQNSRELRIGFTSDNTLQIKYLYARRPGAVNPDRLIIEEGLSGDEGELVARRTVLEGSSTILFIAKHDEPSIDESLDLLLDDVDREDETAIPDLINGLKQCGLSTDLTTVQTAKIVGVIFDLQGFYQRRRINGFE